MLLKNSFVGLLVCWDFVYYPRKRAVFVLTIRSPFRKRRTP